MVDVYINTKENDFRYQFFISTKQGRIQEFVRGEGANFKGTISVISRDSPCKERKAGFTMVPLKPLCVRLVNR